MTRHIWRLAALLILGVALPGATVAHGQAVRGEGVNAFDATETRAIDGAFVHSSTSRGAEIRIEGAAIAKHPIWPVAQQFLELLHAGRIEEAMALGTRKSVATWKSNPADEKAESAAYLRKNLPTRAAASAGVETGRGMRAVLVIEDDKVATLNFVIVEQQPGSPGAVSASSTTQAMAFEKENGQWRVRN